MKKILLSLVFMPIVISNTGSAEVETVVRTEASGENASVHTEITNVVNQKETRIESDQQGEIKVEVKDGEVNIETSPEASPTVVISDLSEEGNQEERMTEEKVVSQLERIQLKISSYLEGLFSRFRRVFSFWN